MSNGRIESLEELNEMVARGGSKIVGNPLVRSNRTRQPQTVPAVALLTKPISFAIPGAPISKPRQTQSDKWKRRPCVVAYREWADDARRMLKAATGIERLMGASGVFATFYIPMPPSWSKKQQAQMEGQPHRQKIDLDNAAKALCDALIVHDETVWKMELQKYWCRSENAKVAVVIFP